MPEELQTARWPGSPKTSSEFITLISHYYRAEITRMQGWRDRIDRTTNWAITVSGAMLSVSLSTPTAHHGVVMFAMILVLFLLVIESRRYRFFDVYRARVRLLERQYFANLFSPGSEVDVSTLRRLSDDLKKPMFLMSRGTAFSRRLRRNYIWMFLVLLVAWLLKISSPKLQPDGGAGHFAHSLSDWVNAATIGPLPGWLVIVAVGAFYAWIVYAALLGRHTGEGEVAIGDVHM
jgi:uncharacterized membrane protein